jgi:hypothetical protein
MGKILELIQKSLFGCETQSKHKGRKVCNFVECCTKARYAKIDVSIQAQKQHTKKRFLKAFIMGLLVTLHCYGGEDVSLVFYDGLGLANCTIPLKTFRQLTIGTLIKFLDRKGFILDWEQRLRPEEYVLSYCGKKIVQGVKFASYDVQAGDIVFLHKETTSEAEIVAIRMREAGLSGNVTEFFRQRHILAGIIDEMSRQYDIAAQREKVSYRVEEEKHADKDSTPQAPTVIGDKLGEISTDPLPCPWQ